MKGAFAHLLVAAAGAADWTPPATPVLWLCAAKSGAVAKEGTWEDQSGNNDATLVGDAVVSTFLDLDGSGDRADLGTGLMDGWTEATVCLWARCASLASDGGIFSHSTGGNTGFLIMRDDSYSGDADLFRVFVGDPDGNRISVECDEDSAGADWVWICATFDGAGDGLRVYLDNVEVTNSPQAPGTVTEISDVPGNSNDVGYDDWNFGYFNGDVDDVLVYNRVLTSDERANIYNNSPGSKQS